MARMKWSIALRLEALLASFNVFAAILAGYYTFDSSRERLQGRAERSLLATTQVLARHMQAGFGTVARDTAFLADAAAVEQDQGRLAELFKANLQAHPAYLQIRYISAGDYGLELVRIDRQGDKLVRVPDDQLQEKSHFPFVFEALSLPDGEVYVSEFGINHEDAAQEAAVPVFNMASPVVQAGQLRGVVVVRVAAAPFLHNFNAALPTPYGFYLSNRWGDFLVHPDATQTFGFDRGQRISLQNPDEILLPGMTAYVNIAVAKRDDVLMVPNAALRFKPAEAEEGSGDKAKEKPTNGEKKRNGEGKGKKRDTSSGTVYVIDGKQLKPVAVQLGITDNRNTEVVSGELKEGDKVIVGENAATVSSKPSSVGMRLF